MSHKHDDDDYEWILLAQRMHRAKGRKQITNNDTTIVGRVLFHCTTSYDISQRTAILNENSVTATLRSLVLHSVSSSPNHVQ